MAPKSLLARLKEFVVGTPPEPTKRRKRSVKPSSKAVSPPRGSRRNATADGIAAAMLAYKPPPPARTKSGKPTLAADWVGFPTQDGRFIERNPNALLFGIVMDRMMDANQAWLSVCRLAQRLGHLDVRIVAKMDAKHLTAILGRWKGEKSLHRFPPTTARHLIAASQRLVNEYESDASNIWSDDPSVRIALKRLLAFDGISDKLANMAVRILVTNYGVKLSGWESIDVAVDRHVARVFLRTGLVPGNSGQTKYRVAEIRDDVVAAARTLSPRFPAALDESGFFIGKYWCTTERAWCSEGEEPCPLADVCPQNRTAWNIDG